MLESEDITGRMKAEFDELWRVKFSHNLSMPDLRNIDWEGIARECYLRGAARAVAIVEEADRK